MEEAKLCEAQEDAHHCHLHPAGPAQNGHAEVIKMLLAAGADKDVAYKDGFTLLHLAAQNGQADVIKMLLAAGANKEEANKNGCTPLYLAARNGHAEVIERLPSSTWRKRLGNL